MTRFFVLLLLIVSNMFLAILHVIIKPFLYVVTYATQLCLKDIATLPQYLREKIMLWDCYGLRHNKEHLADIHADIIFFPIEKQARYADYETVINLAKKEYWLIDRRFGDKTKLLDFLKNGTIYPFATMDVYNAQNNATNVGNLAYVALHAKDDDFRTYCIGILKALRKNAETHQKEREALENSK